jgi:hypothetical protein
MEEASGHLHVRKLYVLLRCGRYGVVATAWSDHDKRLTNIGLPRFRTLRKHHGSVLQPENRLILFPDHPHATARQSRR